MTRKQRNFAIREMANYEDMEVWVSDIALSSIWNDPEDADIPQDRILELYALWGILHKPPRELFAPLGIKDLSERFAIPYRTVQNWYDGNRECAGWIRLLLHDAIDSGE